jgi:hypothetical protein
MLLKADIQWIDQSLNFIPAGLRPAKWLKLNWGD